ncbi:uncharacterized protein F5891DRAFT_1197109 [Suillus fuscotomentosus]|uniref:Uncharacterized protein n=1 Tax=Suillus fuscotomentosus TaxID=1912939 RepID=A0AAD4DRZ2_9AGAM|nr:uncharacterized protein F5891DRAFT_1197109 [Suillus fuscotomentosus]KAG1892838.1 hypothetical protein F5891DRAFT_1197109 [Suillus fuscotomentosus]
MSNASNMQNNNGLNNNENNRASLPQIARARNFQIPDRLLAVIWETMSIACTRANQALHSDTQLLDMVEPPVWTDEETVFLVLWIARERRILEMVLTQLEVLLGLRHSS